MDLINLSRDIERLQKVAEIANKALAEIAALGGGGGPVKVRKKRRTKAEMLEERIQVQEKMRTAKPVVESEYFDKDNRAHRDMLREVVEAKGCKENFDALIAKCDGTIPASKIFLQNIVSTYG